MIDQNKSKVVARILMVVMIGLSGCASTQWSHPDALRDLKHDLTECNYSTMKSVCNFTGASVAPNCSSSNSVTTCKPSVTPASNACHDELQIGPRDQCMQDLGWVNSTE
jgi:hypothetical protein